MEQRTCGNVTLLKRRYRALDGEPCNCRGWRVTTSVISPPSARLSQPVTVGDCGRRYRVTATSASLVGQSCKYLQTVDAPARRDTIGRASACPRSPANHPNRPTWLAMAFPRQRQKAQNSLLENPSTPRFLRARVDVGGVSHPSPQNRARDTPFCPRTPFQPKRRRSRTGNKLLSVSRTTLPLPLMTQVHGTRYWRPAFR